MPCGARYTYVPKCNPRPTILIRETKAGVENVWNSKNESVTDSRINGAKNNKVLIPCNSLNTELIVLMINFGLIRGSSIFLIESRIEFWVLLGHELKNTE